MDTIHEAFDVFRVGREIVCSEQEPSLPARWHHCHTSVARSPLQRWKQVPEHLVYVEKTEPVGQFCQFFEAPRYFPVLWSDLIGGRLRHGPEPKKGTAARRIRRFVPADSIECGTFQCFNCEALLRHPHGFPESYHGGARRAAWCVVGFPHVLYSIIPHTACLVTILTHTTWHVINRVEGKCLGTEKMNNDALVSTASTTMTVNEAWGFVGGAEKISRGSFYAAIRRNDVPHVRLGKRILIPRNALMKWLECAGQSSAAR